MDGRESGRVEDELEAVRVASAELRRAQAFSDAAARRQREVIVAAARAGVARKQIARAAGISRQRVGEFIRDAIKENATEGVGSWDG